MIALEVHINDQKVCTAGLDEAETLSTGVVAVRQKQSPRGEITVSFHAGGAVTEPEELLQWHDSTLKVGDKITVRVIETSKADAPSKRLRRKT